jgi:tetratricopeptide (TPR) repeat protein
VRRATRVLGAVGILALIVVGVRVLRSDPPRPRPPKALATTNAEIYLGNLDGQIAELTRITRAAPSATNAQRLSGLHHVRGRYRGDLDEIALGIDGAIACLELEPDNATCRLMHAEEEQSLHRFAQARAELDRAKKLGADAARVTDLEADLDWNDGRYEPAIEAIRRARRERPTSATWLREAQLDHDLGLEEDAERAFEKAEDLVVDTSPLPLAHLDVQRGIALAQLGLEEDACVFFRAAVARMPDYVAANEHLAEALHALGRNDEATAIYEKVVRLSDDPEFAHALAALYDAAGKKDEARVLEQKARARYEELLATYPEAMYWHASEFYEAIGEAPRARELLEKNLKLRPNSASYVALARAQLAVGDVPAAKASIEAALAMPVRSASLFWTAAAIHRKAGDRAKADDFEARARREYPHVQPS